MHKIKVQSVKHKKDNTLKNVTASELYRYVFSVCCDCVLMRTLQTIVSVCCIATAKVVVNPSVYCVACVAVFCLIMERRFDFYKVYTLRRIVRRNCI